MSDSVGTLFSLSILLSHGQAAHAANHAASAFGSLVSISI